MMKQYMLKALMNYVIACLT